MSKYEVLLIPEGEEENPYTTPCIFYFDEMVKMMDFIEKTLKHGVNIEIKISKFETE